MKTYHIATLPGDGVGPEVTREAIKVAVAAAAITGGFDLDFQHYDVGCAQYLKTGKAITGEVYEECVKADAIYMGAMGLPSADMAPVLDDYGTEVTGQVMFRLRFGMDLFAGVRPIRLYPGVPSALAGHDAIDFVILRESCEGLFSSYGGGSVVRDHVATDTQVITRMGTEKVSHYAFKLALGRNGRVKDGKRMVTCTDKYNVFRSFAFFRKVFTEVAAEYADRVAADYAMIDAMTLWLVQSPENYDVVLAENMHGDIISDMAAAFVGGMGMAPSGDIGHDHAMFQPAHGTAPTIAGKAIVNPTAGILSGRMMLEWLGERHDDAALRAAAALIEAGVSNTFKAGVRTTDIEGNASTTEFGDEVVRQMRLLGE
ncbi:MAG: isocitrate/isopropylmalate dehydrogenase family protein [Planctomycetes bacterium]|nr:isocitrate/isopropylmalate dehydrogenase family protein [Planctomycetota bacterium]